MTTVRDACSSAFLGEAIASGREGTVFGVADQSLGDVVAKVASPKFRFGGPAALRREYAALVKLAAASPSGVRWRFPRPVAFLEDLPAYLMERIDGVRLDEALSVGAFPPAVSADFARAIVDALTCFHGAVGAYGDFHAGNVLIDGDAVVLIDPTIGDPFFAAPLERSVSPLEADVGYWLYAACARSVRFLVSDRTRVERLLDFSRLVLRVASAACPPASPSAVSEVARAHAWRLIRDEAVKGWMIGAGALGLIRRAGIGAGVAS